MTIQTATPYLIFGGKARDAIALYQKTLGATVQTVRRFGDVDDSCPEAQRDLVMHAELRVGNAVILLSDGPGEGGPPSGGAVSIALDLDDPDELRRCLEALGATGKVVQPPVDTPWGALFGVAVDTFGVSWMFHAVTKPGS